MHSGVLGVHLLSSKTLPKVDLDFPVLAWRLPRHHPCVRAFAVCADADVCIKSKSEKKIAQQYRVVFTITAALNSHKYWYLPGQGMPALNATPQAFQIQGIQVFETESNSRSERREGVTPVVCQRSSARLRYIRAYTHWPPCRLFQRKFLPV